MRTKQLLISLTLGLGLTLSLLWLLGGGTPSAHADSPHYVAPDCTGVPTPCHTAIQEAVDAAVPGDEIRVASGVYTGVQNVPSLNTATFTATQVVVITKTVTIRGGYTTTNWTTPYPITQPTMLDAQEQGRVLYITGPGITATLEGLRITGGDATGLGGSGSIDPWGRLYGEGGGVYVISATATISNNQVFSNTAEYGGGLFLYYGDVTLSGNTVTSNTAYCDCYSSGGGGLSLGYSDATLSGNTVNGNTAYGAGYSSAGGLSLGYSNVTLSANTVSGNTASQGGGLILSNSDATLSGNTVISNTASQGGGLILSNSDATLSGNTVISNTASYYGAGGGLRLTHSEATLSGDIVSGNTGSGLYLYESDVTLTNNVVADNSGGGLYIGDSYLRLLHTTIARNGGDGSGVYITGIGLNYSTVALTNTILVSHSVGITVTGGNTVTVNGVLWYGTPVTVSQAVPAIVTVQNQHEGNPAFAADGYHLTIASAAIDQGVNAGVTTDIDGDARPDGCFFDIGADEFITGVACKYIYLPLIMRQYP